MADNINCVLIQTKEDEEYLESLNMPTSRDPNGYFSQDGGGWRKMIEGEK